MSILKINPIEFIDELSKDFKKYYIANNNDDVRAWVGIEPAKKIIFEHNVETYIHLYEEKKHIKTFDYVATSDEGKKIQWIIKKIRSHFTDTANSKFQTEHSDELVDNSIKLISTYFKID